MVTFIDVTIAQYPFQQAKMLVLWLHFFIHTSTSLRLEDHHASRHELSDFTYIPFSTSTDTIPTSALKSEVETLESIDENLSRKGDASPKQNVLEKDKFESNTRFNPKEENKEIEFVTEAVEEESEPVSRRFLWVGGPSKPKRYVALKKLPKRRKANGKYYVFAPPKVVTDHLKGRFPEFEKQMEIESMSSSNQEHVHRTKAKSTTEINQVITNIQKDQQFDDKSNKLSLFISLNSPSTKYERDSDNDDWKPKSINPFSDLVNERSERNLPTSFNKISDKYKTEVEEFSETSQQLSFKPLHFKHSGHSSNNQFRNPFNPSPVDHLPEILERMATDPPKETGKNIFNSPHSSYKVSASDNIPVHPDAREQTSLIDSLYLNLNNDGHYHTYNGKVSSHSKTQQSYLPSNPQTDQFYYENSFRNQLSNQTTSFGQSFRDSQKIMPKPEILENDTEKSVTYHPLVPAPFSTTEKTRFGYSEKDSIPRKSNIKSTTAPEPNFKEQESTTSSRNKLSKNSSTGAILKETMEVLKSEQPPETFKVFKLNELGESQSFKIPRKPPSSGLTEIDANPQQQEPNTHAMMMHTMQMINGVIKEAKQSDSLKRNPWPEKIHRGVSPLEFLNNRKRSADFKRNVKTKLRNKLHRLRNFESLKVNGKEIESNETVTNETSDELRTKQIESWLLFPSALDNEDENKNEAITNSSKNYYPASKVLHRTKFPSNVKSSKSPFHLFSLGNKMSSPFSNPLLDSFEDPQSRTVGPLGKSVFFPPLLLEDDQYSNSYNGFGPSSSYSQGNSYYSQNPATSYSSFVRFRPTLPPKSLNTKYNFNSIKSIPHPSYRTIQHSNNNLPSSTQSSYSNTFTRHHNSPSPHTSYQAPMTRINYAGSSASNILKNSGKRPGNQLPVTTEVNYGTPQVSSFNYGNNVNLHPTHTLLLPPNMVGNSNYNGPAMSMVTSTNNMYANPQNAARGRLPTLMDFFIPGSLHSSMIPIHGNMPHTFPILQTVGSGQQQLYGLPNFGLPQSGYSLPSNPLGSSGGYQAPSSTINKATTKTPIYPVTPSVEKGSSYSTPNTKSHTKADQSSPAISSTYSSPSPSYDSQNIKNTVHDNDSKGPTLLYQPPSMKKPSSSYKAPSIHRPTQSYHTQLAPSQSYSFSPQPSFSSSYKQSSAQQPSQNYNIPSDSYNRDIPSPIPPPSYETSTPSLSYEAPRPSQSYEAPRPSQSYEAPRPSQSYEAPRLSQSYKAPSLSQSYEAPRPSQSYEAPRLSHSYKAPSLSQSYEAPKPSQSYDAPSLSQSYEAHRSSQSYDAPRPSQSYETPMPSQSYKAPSLSQSYEAPRPSQSYDAPRLSQSYDAPSLSQSYDAPRPSQSYEAPRPSQSYDAPRPSQSYDAPRPSQSYDAPRPSQSYEAPRPSQSYDAPRPSQSYEAPRPSQSYHSPMPLSYGHKDSESYETYRPSLENSPSFSYKSPTRQKPSQNYMKPSDNTNRYPNQNTKSDKYPQNLANHHQNLHSSHGYKVPTLSSSYDSVDSRPSHKVSPPISFHKDYDIPKEQPSIPTYSTEDYYVPTTKSPSQSIFPPSIPLSSYSTPRPNKGSHGHPHSNTHSKYHPNHTGSRKKPSRPNQRPSKPYEPSKGATTIRPPAPQFNFTPHGVVTPLPIIHHSTTVSYSYTPKPVVQHQTGSSQNIPAIIGSHYMPVQSGLQAFNPLALQNLNYHPQNIILPLKPQPTVHPLLLMNNQLGNTAISVLPFTSFPSLASYGLSLPEQSLSNSYSKSSTKGSNKSSATYSTDYGRSKTSRPSVSPKTPYPVRTNKRSKGTKGYYTPEHTRKPAEFKTYSTLPPAKRTYDGKGKQLSRSLSVKTKFKNKYSKPSTGKKKHKSVSQMPLH